jgi:hypothetical protein
MLRRKEQPHDPEQHLRKGLLFMFDDGIGGCADGAEKLLSTSAPRSSGPLPASRATARSDLQPGHAAATDRATPPLCCHAQSWRTMTHPASSCITTPQVQSRRPLLPRSCGGCRLAHTGRALRALELTPAPLS